MAFDPRPYLKELARGRHGSRDLTREQAATLFAAVLDGSLSELALGALLAAYRIKGETAAEIAGMLDAVASRVEAVRLPRTETMSVIIPTYNGSRKLPNLVPLLALLLARAGVPVLLHGVAHEPQRVGSFEILELLGHAPVRSLEEAEARLTECKLAALPINLLAPPLARVIDARLQTGVRNSAHTLAKLLLPKAVMPADACRLISVTHPDFHRLMRELFEGHPANVFLMRGVEGEAVVRLHAPQAIDYIGADGSVSAMGIEEAEAQPALPARDAASTAAWTRDVLEGKQQPPAALAAQARLIARIAAGNRAAPPAPAPHLPR